MDMKRSKQDMLVDLGRCNGRVHTWSGFSLMFKSERGVDVCN